MVALLEGETVSKKGWISRDEFLDMTAIAESTPGPIAINMATYMGYKLLGIGGSAVATVAVCIPSFVIIYVISLFLEATLSFDIVHNAFRGIGACVVYLIFSAGTKMLKAIKKTPFNIAVVICVMLCVVLSFVMSVKFSSVFYILICGVLGLFVNAVFGMDRRGGGGK